MYQVGINKGIILRARPTKSQEKVVLFTSTVLIQNAAHRLFAVCKVCICNCMRTGQADSWSSQSVALFYQPRQTEFGAQELCTRQPAARQVCIYILIQRLRDHLTTLFNFQLNQPTKCSNFSSLLLVV